LSPEIELALYRIAQEALTNVAKHADATHATIDLQFREGTVSLRIEDDGRGFEPREGLGRGLGLFGMRERAELVHGTFALESEPGHGTRITIAVPLESRTQFASTTGVRA
jgi:two-component system sensor histidine kinase UhpB